MFLCPRYTDEIIEYFKVLTSQVDHTTFKGEGWQVIITRLRDRKHGSISIPRTQLKFSGRKEIIEDVIVKYRKKFMRGGG